MRREFSCGAQTLKDYLFYHRSKGIIPRGDISNFQDIIEEAKFYCTLFPQKTLNLVKVSPCIVKFGVDHFVLVNGISQGIVYYLDNSIPLQLPLDDFLFWWKGYVLSEQIDDSAQILKEDECLKISGHKKGGGNIWKMLVPIGIGLLTGGTGFALAPWFGSTATGALLGGATSAGMAGGKPKNWLTQGLLGAAGAAGGAKFATGFMAPGTTAATSMGQVTVKPTLWQQLSGGAKGLMGTGGVGNVSGTAARTSINPLTQVATAMGKPLLAGQTAQGAGFTYTSGGGWTAATPKVSAPTTTTPTAPTTPAPAGLGEQLLGKGIQSYLPSLLAGGVSAGMKLPELPDLEANYREVSQRVLGGSPLSNLATNRAMAIMQGEPLTEEDEQAILNIFNDRERESLEQVNKQYQVVGRLGSEENQEQLRKTKEYWATQKAYGLYAARKDAQAVQTQVMQAAWGYDQNQINQMLALAERTGDVEELKWSIRAGDTMGVKSTLDKLAQLLWPQGATAKV